jgi:hypothetical protein
MNSPKFSIPHPVFSLPTLQPPHRQITAIVLAPTFPGWFAPLTFNPLRFAEFANFASMLVAAWVVAACLTGGSGVGVGVWAEPRASVAIIIGFQ